MRDLAPGNSSELNRYQSPFSVRYGSPEMSSLFSLQYKHSLWRRIWVVLAKCQQNLGLNISSEQIDEMEQHIDDIDFAAAEAYEKELKHDVMAHIRIFADLCPLAQPIIHLGATSCLITDNADLIIAREALGLVRTKLALAMKNLAKMAMKYKDLPCLAYTHLQPAQPTTVGKRMADWLYGLETAYRKLDQHLEELPALGAKGATGTQASFLQLFEGDHNLVEKLDREFAERLGFSKTVPVSGQTYSRQIDTETAYCLSRICQAARKMATDMRILSSFKEMGEAFGKNQVGSTAMPYKRNPIKWEQICSLAENVLSASRNAEEIASTQWMERTLDDSANRRIYLPEMFLAVDTILSSLIPLIENIQVDRRSIERRLNEELPFLVTENLMMACSRKKQGDRQALHEEIRKISMEVRDRMAVENSPNDLLDKLRKSLPLTAEEFDRAVDPKTLVGRAPQLTENYIAKLSPLID